MTRTLIAALSVVSFSVLAPLHAGNERPVFAGEPLTQPTTTAAAVTPSPGSTLPAFDRVSPELRQQIAERGSADAMIILDAALPVSRDARLREVSRVQDEVLAPLAGQAIQGLYRFRAIPALFGHVTAAQLALLESSPRVVRIGHRRRGTGGLSQSRALIGADKAQAVTGLSGSGVTVAVLDSGFPIEATDLSGKLVGEHCFCDDDFVAGNGIGCCPDGSEEQAGAGSSVDDHGHGGHVTGIIASSGDNDVASTGIAPGVGIVAIKVLNSGNSGFLSDWAKGLDKVLADFPNVGLINMSLQSGAVFTGDCSATDADNAAMASAITALRALDVATITITGNFSIVGSITSPGCIDGAIAVGAVHDEDFGSFDFGSCTDPTTAADQVTCFSNVDASKGEYLLAPGCNTVSTVFGFYSTLCGTSMASPHVVGAAALLREHNGPTTVSSLFSTLSSTGVPVFDPRIGLSDPRIDVWAAIDDGDADGIPNAGDNCPEDYNPGQENADIDSYGDACDLCPTLNSADQTDDDHDHIGNPCDGDPLTNAPERLFVVTDFDSGPWPGTIFELDRGSRTIVNSFPTPSSVGLSDVGLGYSTHRNSLFFTNPADDLIFEVSASGGGPIHTYSQADVNGFVDMGAAGVCDGGLLTTAPGPSQWLTSPLDGFPGFFVGFGLPPILDGQGATGGNDEPASADDHAGWLAFRNDFFSALPQNTISSIEMSGGFVRGLYRAPVRCIAPGANTTLDTAPAGDDLVVANEIHFGPNGACDTVASAGDDLVDFAEYGVNALGAVDRKVIYSLSGLGDPLSPVENALYVDDGFAPDPDADPLLGPVRLDRWEAPVPTGPNGILAIAAGPTDSDGDGVINDLDNCPALANGQLDGDLDGHGDLCDNCPVDFNPLQLNNDGDIQGDVCDLNDDNDVAADITDCASLDATAWGQSGPAADLLIDRTAGVTGFSWTAPVDPGATVVSYDLLRTDDPIDFATPVCVASDIAVSSTTELVDPGPNVLWSYLPRAENDCPQPDDLGRLGDSFIGNPPILVPRASAPDCP